MGKYKYGISTDDILEIIPMVETRELPKTPDYILGIFDYHGHVVPLIDLCKMTTGEFAKRVLSTRIIIAKLKDPHKKNDMIGLLAEKMTDNLEVDPKDFEDPGVAASKDALYLGSIVKVDNDYIQYVDIHSLLSEETRRSLFQDEEESTTH